MKKQEPDKAFNKQWQQTIERGSLTFGVKLSENQLNLLAFHAQELIKWNGKFNITAIVEPFEVALKHFIDSIAIAPLIPDGSKVIDLGSGGGFPGLPLKIVNPTLEVIMADASRKKVSFLSHIILQTGINRQTNLNGVRAIHCRAEELGKIPEYAHKFDFVVSRAFTALNRFTDMALPLLKSNGTVLAMKGELKPDELTTITSRKDIEAETSEYFLPFEQHRRCMVKIKQLA